MKLKLLACVLPVLMGVTVINVNAVEVHKWNGKPIELDLLVNQQRLVRLPDNAMFRFPSGVKKDIDAEMAAGVLYIRTKKNLNNIPLEIKLASTGEIIKLNVNTSSKGARLPQINEDLRIVMPWEKNFVEEHAKSEQKNVSSKQHKGLNQRFGATPEEFIRYAAMRDFEPQRLWKTNFKIKEYPVPKNLKLTELFYGESTGVFDVAIHKIYKSGTNYLTVLSLRNKRLYPVSIKFDDIAIDFQYASVPEPYYSLGSVESDQDFSFLYLITKQPINQLIKVVDPTINSTN